MNKTFLGITVLLISLIFATSSQAASYGFVPNPPDLNDLDHYKYYTWGIDWTPLAGEHIVAATLSIDDLNNWDTTDNHLYMHLLDYAPLGVTVGTDNQGGGDYFSPDIPGQSIHLDTYIDADSAPIDYSYMFTPSDVAALNSYVADDNRFALGFDPDCHYWNNAVTFSICTRTSAVPEPASLLLLTSGLLGGLVRRKFFGA